jgi:hypothetical protein
MWGDNACEIIGSTVELKKMKTILRLAYKIHNTMQFYGNVWSAPVGW